MEERRIEITDGLREERETECLEIIRADKSSGPDRAWFLESAFYTLKPHGGKVSLILAHACRTQHTRAVELIEPRYYAFRELIRSCFKEGVSEKSICHLFLKAGQQLTVRVALEREAEKARKGRSDDEDDEDPFNDTFASLKMDDYLPEHNTTLVAVLKDRILVGGPGHLKAAIVRKGGQVEELSGMRVSETFQPEVQTFQKRMVSQDLLILFPETLSVNEIKRATSETQDMSRVVELLREMDTAPDSSVVAVKMK